MSREAPRYYAYNPDIGRVRVPIDVVSKGEEAVIEWAAGRHAVNVVREDGPPSKPTAVEFVWRADVKRNPATGAIEPK